VARRGTARLDEDSASAAWRAAGEAARHHREADDKPTAWQPEEWIDEGAVRDEAEDAVGRGRRKGTDRQAPARGDEDDEETAVAQRESRRGKPREIDADVRKAVGGSRAPRFEKRLRDASDAFRRGRYEDTRRMVRPLAEMAPQLPAVRELYGLTLYHLGRWQAAARELEAFRTLTASVEQHPVLADCYRALRRYNQVDELWQELSAASPGAALVAEGRIVAAGALADQGRIDDAIKLLEPGVRPARKAKEHHLRVAYVLADLYERAGDLPQARELFQRVFASDPSFVDVESRLRALR
jgi:tetratricopeptide (TPR) repeat protein